MTFKPRYMRTGTNSKGITAALEKALKRAHWYSKNYPGASDFRKRLIKQYYTVLIKFVKTKELTNDQFSELKNGIPSFFKNEVWENKLKSCL